MTPRPTSAAFPFDDVESSPIARPNLGWSLTELRLVASVVFVGLFVPTMTGFQCWFALGVGR